MAEAPPPGSPASPTFPAAATRLVALGAASWSLLVIFFTGQAIAQAGVAAPYSLLDNAISDLGATSCGPLTIGTYQTAVCSPWHPVMNGTFVASGLLTLLGALGSWRAWPPRRLSAWGWCS
jgi:hypothetical protein